jgi:hypothetical protein
MQIIIDHRYLRFELVSSHRSAAPPLDRVAATVSIVF